MSLYELIMSWLTGNSSHLSPDQLRTVRGLLHELRIETNDRNSRLLTEVNTVRNIMESTNRRFNEQLSTTARAQGNVISEHTKLVEEMELRIKELNERQHEKDEFYGQKIDDLSKELLNLKVEMENKKTEKEEKSTEKEEKSTEKFKMDPENSKSVCNLENELEADTSDAIGVIKKLLESIGKQPSQGSASPHSYSNINEFGIPSLMNQVPCGVYNNNCQPSMYNNYTSPGPNNYRSSRPRNYRSSGSNNYRSPGPYNYRSSGPSNYYPMPGPSNYPPPGPSNYPPPGPSNYPSPGPSNYPPPGPHGQQQTGSSNYRSPGPNCYQPSGPNNYQSSFYQHGPVNSNNSKNWNNNGRQYHGNIHQSKSSNRDKISEEDKTNQNRNDASKDSEYYRNDLNQNTDKRKPDTRKPNKNFNRDGTQFRNFKKEKKTRTFTNRNRRNGSNKDNSTDANDSYDSDSGESNFSSVSSVSSKGGFKNLERKNPKDFGKSRGKISDYETASESCENEEDSDQQTTGDNVSAEAPKGMKIPTRQEAYLKNINIYTQLKQVIVTGKDNSGKEVSKRRPTLNDVYDFQSKYKEVRIIKQ